MHCLFAWHLKPGATPDVRRQVDALFTGVLEGESFARLWPRMYVVRISSPKERDLLELRVRPLRDGLGENANRMNYVIGPAVEAGQTYTGWLPKSVWPELNRRTRDV